MKISQMFWLAMLLAASAGFSQDHPGQLLQNLKNETRPEKQHEILLSLGAHYQFSNFDSAMYFHNRAYNLALELERNARRADRNRFAHLRAKATLGMMRVHDVNGNLDTAIVIATRLLPEAIALKDTVMIVSVYLSIGNVNLHKGNFSEALDLYKRVIEIASQAGNDLYVARANQNMGVVFYHQGNYTKAAEATSIASELYEKLGNNVGVASTKLLLGNLVAELGQPERALNYYIEALLGFEKANHPNGIYTSLLNIGTTFHDLKQYNEAIDYFTQAYNAAFALDDQTGVSRTLHNIGLSYLMMEESEHSLEYFNRALDIAAEHQLQHQKAHTLVSLARANNNLGRNRVAIQFANQGLALAKEMDMISTQESAYRNLWIAYNRLGNLRQALDNHILYKILSDSVNSVQSRVEISRIETQIHNRYLEEQIRIKETDLENQRLELQKTSLRLRLEQSQKIILASGFLILLAVTAYIFNNSRKRKKLNALFIEKNRIAEEANHALVAKNNEIAGHRDEINQQKSIIEEKNIALLSSISYARTIQQSMLPFPEKANDILGEHIVIFNPKEIVSGDFYWMRKSGSKTVLVVADCAGHGVPGAFISIKGLSYLNDYPFSKSISNTGEFLDTFRSYMVESLQQANTPVHQHEVIELAIVSFDKESGEVEFSGARIPLIIASEGQVLLNGKPLEPETGKCYKVKPDPMAIVFSENLKPFSTQTIQVEKGSILYLITDGFADQFGGDNGDRYSYQRLYNKLSLIHLQDLAEQQRLLNGEIHAWRQNHEQIDDITLIGVRV